MILNYKPPRQSFTKAYLIQNIVICHSGNSDSGESAIPLVEIPIGASTSEDSDPLFIELKEKTKIMVEYPHPRIRKFSNIRLVCFSSVHLFCRNTQMRLLVQPHESCHKNISKRGIFFLILMIYYVI